MGRARAKPTIPDERKGGFRPSTHPMLAEGIYMEANSLISSPFFEKIFEGVDNVTLVHKQVGWVGVKRKPTIPLENGGFPVCVPFESSSKPPYFYYARFSLKILNFSLYFGNDKV